MYTIEGYWDTTPEIKSVSFPLRGKMQVDFVDGRIMLLPLSKFPSIKKLSVKDRKDWYIIGNGFSFDKCDEVIHVEQLLGNCQLYMHEA